MQQASPKQQFLLPQYGPSLAALYGDRFRALPLVARVLVIALAVGVIALLAWKVFGESKGSTTYVQREPVAFNFRYAGDLKKVPPQNGEFVRLEAQRDGLFTQSFAVAPLAMPARYAGMPGSNLPVYAEQLLPGLKARFKDFQVVGEQRIFVNQVPGYAITFQARLGKRALYGRYILLPGPQLGSREGVTLLLLSTPAAGTYNAATVGSIGANKLPFRSFRFGTQSP